MSRFDFSEQVQMRVKEVRCTRYCNEWRIEIENVFGDKLNIGWVKTEAQGKRIAKALEKVLNIIK